MEPKDIVPLRLLSRRVCLSGALLFLMGGLLPSFRGYVTFNGIETALLFLNDRGTIFNGTLLLASYALSILNAASCLLGIGAMRAARSVGIGLHCACFLAAWILSGLPLLPGAWIGALGMAAELAGAFMAFADKGRA
jgi:hypothetical protein